MYVTLVYKGIKSQIYVTNRELRVPYHNTQSRYFAAYQRGKIFAFRAANLLGLHNPICPYKLPLWFQDCYNRTCPVTHEHKD